MIVFDWVDDDGHTGTLIFHDEDSSEVNKLGRAVLADGLARASLGL